MVHLLPVRLWLPRRPPLRPSLWPCGASHAAGIRLWKFETVTFSMNSHAHVAIEKESGNIFSSFSAGLTAGVDILPEQWLWSAIANDHHQKAFVWGVLVDIIGTYVLYLPCPEILSRSWINCPRPPVRLQPDSLNLFDLRVVPCSAVHLQWSPRPYSLRWLWCWREHSD